MLSSRGVANRESNLPMQPVVLFADKGPHFYINMEEKIRGDLRETCFGRIVEGQAILDVMASHHEKNFRGMSMVGIESVRVLKPASDPIGDPRLATSEIGSTSY
jgi:Cyclophilin type peptidyl-prolyl cis-trans isomerase/CLD